MIYNIESLSGIYCIKNQINNKIYIGSTSNFNKRFKKHLILLRKNKHHSRLLQNSYNKYGNSVFIFSILEYTTDLINREQYYLDLYRPFLKENGYNISPTAYNNTGIKRSFEYKKKKSDAYLKHEFIVTSPEGIEIITKNLRYVEILVEGKKLSEKRVKQGLNRLVSGKVIKQNFYGWKCRYKDPILYNTTLKILENTIAQNKINKQFGIEQAKKSKTKQWKLIHLNGTIEIFNGIKEIEEKYCLTNISRAAKIGYSCNGFKIEKLN